MFFSVASMEAYFSAYLVFWCGDALLRSSYMLSYYNRKKLCPMLRISVLRAGEGLVRGGSVYVYMREMTGYDFRQKKGCGKILSLPQPFGDSLFFYRVQILVKPDADGCCLCSCNLGDLIQMHTSPVKSYGYFFLGFCLSIGDSKFN